MVALEEEGREAPAAVVVAADLEVHFPLAPQRGLAVELAVRMSPASKLTVGMEDMEEARGVLLALYFLGRPP